MNYSHGMMSSYLEEDLALKLRSHLNLPKEEDLEKENKNRASKKRDSALLEEEEKDLGEINPKKKAKPSQVCPP